LRAKILVTFTFDVFVSSPARVFSIITALFYIIKTAVTLSQRAPFQL